MIRIKGLRVSIEEVIDYKKVIAKRLKVNKEDIKSYKIHKQSIDARNKMMFSYVFDFDVEIDNEDKYLDNNIVKVETEEYVLPSQGSEIINNRVYVVGAGPAGLFAALKLATYGYKPIVIDRGQTLLERINTINDLWENNKLNEESNVCFGEGGAGTFSDGKLNTLVKDKYFRMKEVFKTFVECGAPEEIMYDSKPHIGTDILRNVIVNLREKIISLGGEFRFNSKLEDIIIKDSKLEAIAVNNEVIPCNILILAIGHSAKDTFNMLYEKKLCMESKPFAVGLRIIHPQEMINENQYPINYKFLPSASYKLTYNSKSKHGVYSFCMCPGGYVVNTSTNKNRLCINGMSNYKRDSGYANSAIIVTVGPDIYGNNTLDGLKFQSKLEENAYKLGNGFIPVQKYVDYKIHKISDNIESDAFKGNIKCADLNKIFPDIINENLKEGIDYFDNKIKGFNGDSAILAGVESRTSSPIRILRDEFLESNIKGIYPCGEGAGYAGGITTSAMDGIKVFESIYKRYKNN